MKGILLVILALLGAACSGEMPSHLATRESEGEIIALPSPRMMITTFTPTLEPTWTQSVTLIPSITPTPDLYSGLTIEDLRRRNYVDGQLTVVEMMAENSRFIRYLVRYPSDGLDIYGFMNVPTGDGPFPVVIALHGYIDPDLYTTLDYTTGYADELARSGFLVLHPNLRGYPPSDDGFNLFRVGMAIDVLNLIAIVKDQAGEPGPLEKADEEHVGLWGHSMGGGIATRVMTVSPNVDAVLLYGAMSGDEQKNFERIFSVFSEGKRGLEELEAPPDVFLQISPINFLEGVQSAVSIHHGMLDSEVPAEWSIDLCDRLTQSGKVVECFYYADQPHTFMGDGDRLFISRMVDFFNRYLR